MWPVLCVHNPFPSCLLSFCTSLSLLFNMLSNGSSWRVFCAYIHIHVYLLYISVHVLESRLPIVGNVVP